MVSSMDQPKASRRRANVNKIDSIRKLLADWVARGASSTKATNYLMLALQYDLEDVGLDVGRKLIHVNGTSASSLSFAILTVGKYGDDEDRALLEPLLNNTKICHTWHNGPNEEPVHIEVRDVALAALIHLTGQNHDDYGFDLLRRYPRTLFHIHTLGFAENVQREAAMKKWRAWSRSQSS